MKTIYLITRLKISKLCFFFTGVEKKMFRLKIHYHLLDLYTCLKIGYVNCQEIAGQVDPHSGFPLKP
jgi:hypothetical protein